MAWRANDGQKRYVQRAAVRSVQCANLLGDEAVAAGLRISGLVEVYSFEGPNVDRSAR